LPEDLINVLTLLNAKQKHNLTNQAFIDILEIFANGESSLYLANKKLSKLVNIKPVFIDMCINSCCAFTGSFIQNKSCHICGELGFIMKNNVLTDLPRKVSTFIPLIDRFRFQYNNLERAMKLRYHYQYVNQQDDNSIGDLFDGNLYKELVEEGYFIDERDIALIGSTDGFQLFKQKTDDCWVVMFINANLPPSEQVKKENLLISLIIPGPNQPKYFNSFLRPVINELKLLEGNDNLI
jgi:hypothetical protein